MPHRYFRLKNIRQIVKWRRFQAVHQILTYSLRTYFLPSKTLNGFNGFTQIPRLVPARNEPHTLRGYVNGNTKLLGYFSCLPDPHIYESCTDKNNYFIPVGWEPFNQIGAWVPQWSIFTQYSGSWPGLSPEVNRYHLPGQWRCKKFIHAETSDLKLNFYFIYHIFQLQTN